MGDGAGGGGRCMIIAVNPHPADFDEALQALRHAPAPAVAALTAGRGGETCRLRGPWWMLCMCPIWLCVLFRAAAELMRSPVGSASRHARRRVLWDRAPRRP